ncbi:sigma-70 family RNA polymerase sigma factor [Komagataeibacter sucrofermentans]|uniref:Uncharacterized protein n=1 Tax=Komagataeibacter sucrofermentans TaxID=1053551 RepID=A0A318QKF4_9PROT|nr:sigma-70 family RNA polymerase sigma factor [Komagataeibacter sucrofermentans]PYD79966.1 hypothetical protein CFR77_05500 [Komagataeibacter sucrofermentans]GBQ52200.1 hypothetical protein AA15973_2692 [Komagataeibacter sucrofermentans DSM 15973]
MAAKVDWDAARAELVPLLVEGLPYAEIAHRLGLTYSAVNFRVGFLGLTHLRQCGRKGRAPNHVASNLMTEALGTEYEPKVKKERIKRSCCRCRKAFVAESRFLFRCEPCRRVPD